MKCGGFGVGMPPSRIPISLLAVMQHSGYTKSIVGRSGFFHDQPSPGHGLGISGPIKMLEIAEFPYIIGPVQRHPDNLHDAFPD